MRILFPLFSALQNQKKVLFYQENDEENGDYYVLGTPDEEIYATILTETSGKNFKAIPPQELEQKLEKQVKQLVNRCIFTSDFIALLEQEGKNDVQIQQIIQSLGEKSIPVSTGEYDKEDFERKGVPSRKIIEKVKYLEVISRLNLGKSA